MTAPNAALAYSVYDLAMAHRVHLDMNEWSSGLVDLAALTEGCGTTACYAGWTAAHAGYKVHVSGDVYTADGSHAAANVAVFAARLLGITDEQAEDLFFVDEEDLGDAVADIFGPRPGEHINCPHDPEGADGNPFSSMICSPMPDGPRPAVTE